MFIVKHGMGKLASHDCTWPIFMAAFVFVGRQITVTVHLIIQIDRVLPLNRGQATKAQRRVRIGSSGGNAEHGLTALACKKHFPTNVILWLILAHEKQALHLNPPSPST
jgi:hypothetical protein